MVLERLLNRNKEEKKQEERIETNEEKLKQELQQITEIDEATTKDVYLSEEDNFNAYPKAIEEAKKFLSAIEEVEERINNIEREIQQVEQEIAEDEKELKSEIENINKMVESIAGLESEVSNQIRKLNDIASNPSSPILTANGLEIIERSGKNLEEALQNRKGLKLDKGGAPELRDYMVYLATAIEYQERNINRLKNEIEELEEELKLFEKEVKDGEKDVKEIRKTIKELPKESKKHVEEILEKTNEGHRIPGLKITRKEAEEVSKIEERLGKLEEKYEKIKNKIEKLEENDRGFEGNYSEFISELKTIDNDLTNSIQSLARGYDNAIRDMKNIIEEKKKMENIEPSGQTEEAILNIKRALDNASSLEEMYLDNPEEFERLYDRLEVRMAELKGAEGSNIDEEFEKEMRGDDGFPKQLNIFKKRLRKIIEHAIKAREEEDSGWKEIGL